MRNDTETQITITMNNVDHAHRFVEALNVFFNESDKGGDCIFIINNFDDKRMTYDRVHIGHDVRKPKIEMKYIIEPEKESCPNGYR